MNIMHPHSREKQLKYLDSFINTKQTFLNSVLNKLGWSEESLNDKVKVSCSINPEHWIPQSSLLHHKDICKSLKDGCQREELDRQPPDSTFFYEKSPNIIPVKIDDHTQAEILAECGLLTKDNAGSMNFPSTVERWNAELNPEWRLAVYDYIINKSKMAEKPKNVTVEDLMFDFEKKQEEEDRPKTELELMAEKRDYKRRRQSYRAKNVHITKKSYTEVMKEVIENQINYLSEMRKLENAEKLKKENEDTQSYKRQQSPNTDDYSNDSRDHHSGYRDDYRRQYHSYRESSKHSSKSKKHKRDRSRSRSPEYHRHKKSHKRRRSRE